MALPPELVGAADAAGLAAGADAGLSAVPASLQQMEDALLRRNQQLDARAAAALRAQQEAAAAPAPSIEQGALPRGSAAGGARPAARPAGGGQRAAQPRASRGKPATPRDEGRADSAPQPRKGDRPGKDAGSRPAPPAAAAAGGAQLSSAVAVTSAPPAARPGSSGDAGADSMRVRVAALEEELKAAAVRATRLEQEKAKLGEESGRQQKLITALSQRLEKEKQRSDDLAAKGKEQEQQLAVLKRDLTAAQKQSRLAEAATAAKDLRLQRALEEADRARGESGEASGRQGQEVDELRSQNSRIAQENKRLQQQRQELLAVHKKQQRLIDVLKRQKLHIEAAKLLSFTEEEFARTLEIGESLGS
eukprot:TRINITY_DN9839_c0_g1_i1.p2 TRINITY_DN9839_c0_g1~~TRINITY_DN9839_c0_g1_i1.p2  ORF type:complete len:363 (+),score=146.24 TRINITY_DN9839_c0_g1_i1:80-1168(+)